MWPKIIKSGIQVLCIVSANYFDDVITPTLTQSWVHNKHSRNICWMNLSPRARPIFPTIYWTFVLICCCSVVQLCPTLCNPIDCSTPGFPVPHYLPEFAQVHVHWIGDAIQPSHPLLFSSVLISCSNFKIYIHTWPHFFPFKYCVSFSMSICVVTVQRTEWPSHLNSGCLIESSVILLNLNLFTEPLFASFYSSVEWI